MDEEEKTRMGKIGWYLKECIAEVEKGSKKDKKIIEKLFRNKGKASSNISNFYQSSQDEISIENGVKGLRGPLS